MNVNAGKTLVVVPVKDPALSKTRLGGDLSPRQRAGLVRLLLRRTLDMLHTAQASTDFDIAIVTQSDEIMHIARRADVQFIHEPERQGLNPAVTRAAEYAEAKGYIRLCILPADLAAPDPADLLHILATRAAVTICPATDQGTNALLVSPPTAIAFQYGPRSAIRHFQAAEAAGLRAVLMPLESLSFDIDTSDNLTRALKTWPRLQEDSARA